MEQSSSYNAYLEISIHALLAESDGVTVLGIQHRVGISIHALLAESDVFCFCLSVFDFLFLSTLSLRRATLFFIVLHLFNSNFYPRSPCGERHQILEDTSGATNHFYPRSPCGERLVILRKRDTPLTISIHALLAESD